MKDNFALLAFSILHEFLSTLGKLLVGFTHNIFWCENSFLKQKNPLFYQCFNFFSEVTKPQSIDTQSTLRKKKYCFIFIFSVFWSSFYTKIPKIPIHTKNTSNMHDRLSIIKSKTTLAIYDFEEKKRKHPFYVHHPLPQSDHDH